MNRTELLDIAVSASIEAGKKIMEVYYADYSIDFKEDHSPLTIADKTAHNVISKKLLQTGIPVMSEEGENTSFDIRKSWETLWLVDPLDGTKEFIKKNGEFTVNIALIEKNKPTLGVIFCPVFNILYLADQTLGGAFKVNLSKNWKNIPADTIEILKMGKKLPLINYNNKFTISASRSHMNSETKNFINRIEKQVGEIEYHSRGSSLKLCMVAEGNALIYPRFAPTCEWDTAAGQAIVEYAGGKVIQTNNSEPVIYNKKNVLNPYFLAIAKDVANTIEL